DDLFTNERAAKTFDEVQLRRHFVRTIHRDVDFRMLVKARQREAGVEGYPGRLVRCRNSGNLHSSLPEVANEDGSGVAATQTNDHPVPYLLERRQGGLPLEIFTHGKSIISGGVPGSETHCGCFDCL